MTDLAIGLSPAHAGELATIAATVEAAFTAVNTAQAQLTRALADADRLAETVAAGSPRSVKERDMARRAIAAEIAVPLRLSDRSVQAKMGHASVLVDEYPATMSSWEAGRISHGHVTVILDAGRDLPAETRAGFEALAVPICERQSTVRAREAVTMLAQRVHPTSLTDRHRTARDGRRVWVETVGEGMSRLTADVPTLLGEGIHDRLTRITTTIIDTRAQAHVRLREARAAGVAEYELDPTDTACAADTRTREQIRADVLVDLLLTGTPDADPTNAGDGHGELGAIRAHVQVVVNATTLLGVDDAPADLVGSSPVDAATARQLVGNCTGFDRLIVHPITGQVLATDGYTPTRDLRRRLRARDRHCRFPGCRIPAIRCEHDHTVDHAHGGPTCLTNLAGLCQRHHSTKQFTPWTVRQLLDGVLEWTSPTGRVYIDEPPTPLVWFVPDDGTPPPF